MAASNRNRLLLISAIFVRRSGRPDFRAVVPSFVLREPQDGRASKSAVADFDTLRLPKSGKPDFGARPPQDEVRWVPSANFDGVEIRRCTGNSTIPKRCEKCPQIPFGANSMV